MKDALRERIADAVDLLSELDALAEASAGRMPPLLLARALVQVNGIAAGLARLRQTLAYAAGKTSADSTPRNPAGGE